MVSMERTRWMRADATCWLSGMIMGTATGESGPLCVLDVRYDGHVVSGVVVYDQDRVGGILAPGVLEMKVPDGSCGDPERAVDRF